MKARDNISVPVLAVYSNMFLMTMLSLIMIKKYFKYLHCSRVQCFIEVITLSWSIRFNIANCRFCGNLLQLFYGIKIDFFKSNFLWNFFLYNELPRKIIYISYDRHSVEWKSISYDTEFFDYEYPPILADWYKLGKKFKETILYH